ncbi:MAG: hypothetical protein ThorAB25_20200 [Candidatus Thorarchaeota archaeon AB_25]|jgi:predicted DNA-binding protein (UPF0251 family)|nr:MAG: hypothetical protein ThorAB25_20200 [Candidatus Thorarchaeota archaeon AB_25]
MPRRKRHRFVHREPTVSVYKPAGIPAKELEEILLTVDEFEAIRLADYEGLNQREACTTMKISQPTFNRILASARNKIAKGIVEGQVLRIEGGRYVLGDGSGGLQCLDCDYRLDMDKDQRNACPKCGSPKLRWQRWDSP